MLDSFGGIERVINQIAILSKDFGIDAEVLSLSNTSTVPTTKFNGYLVHREKKIFELFSNSFSVSCLFRFIKLAKKADIIHYHYPWPFMDIIHFFSMIKKPSIITYHSDIIRQKILNIMYTPLRHFFFKSVDKIVCTSPNYLKTSKILTKYEEKLNIIPIGLNKNLYSEPSFENQIYWKRKLPPRFFLFIGYFRYYKGLHSLIDAVHYNNSKYPVVLIGSGKIEKELKKKILNLQIKNIIFLKNVTDEDKISILKLCYAFLFPSDLRSEAFGVSLVEAAMHGKPLISCEIGTGTTFVNISNETGLVIPPRDYVALAKAMQYLWDNPELSAIMGFKAKERYEALFTGDKMLKKYLNLYHEVLKKK